MHALHILHEAARRVLGCLGSAHSESVYRNALVSELSAQGFNVRTEVCCPFIYNNECVGHGRADITFDGVVVELKSRPCNTANEQVLRYATALRNIEQREFVAVVISFTSSVAMVAFDSCGTTIFDSTQKSGDIKASHIMDSTQCMAALKRAYRFVGQHSTHSQHGVPYNSIFAVLSRRIQDKPTIKRFIQKHFKSHLSRRNTRGTRRLMCALRDGRHLVPL